MSDSKCFLLAVIFLAGVFIAFNHFVLTPMSQNLVPQILALILQ